MTTDTVHPGDDPRRLLSTARELTRRVRKAQRATWFPLLVFAVLTLVSLPVRRYSGHYQTCATRSAGHVCTVYTNADLVYWPIALVLAYVGIVAFYIRRTRALGIGTRTRPYAIAGIVIAVTLSAIAIWEFHHPLLVSNPEFTGLLTRLASPGTAIGLALIVLAWAERNRPLLLFTLVYLTVVLARITFSATQVNPPWYGYPAIAQGTVLLLGAIGFALAQRPLRTPTS